MIYSSLRGHMPPANFLPAVANSDYILTVEHIVIAATLTPTTPGKFPNKSTLSRQQRKVELMKVGLSYRFELIASRSLPDGLAESIGTKTRNLGRRLGNLSLFMVK